MKTNKISLRSVGCLLLALMLLLTACGSKKSVNIKSEYLNLTAIAEDAYKTTTSYKGDFSIDFSIDTRMTYLTGREIYWKYSGDHFGELMVETGQIVSKGDVLMTVDVSVSEADLLARQLSVTEAQASLDQVDTSYSNQIAQRSAAAMGLEGVELSIAQYELQQLQYEYAARREAASYRVAQAEKSLQELLDHQAATQVVAPYDGYIVYVTRYFRSGDIISTSEPLIGIADISTAAIQITNANKTYSIPYLSTVTLTDMRDQKTYTGTVVSCGDVTDDEEDLVTIIPDVSFESGALQGSIRVTGQLISVTNVILIDSRAIRSEGSSRYVLVLNDGNVSKVYVKVGGSNTTTTWITEGLSEGQTVVLP